MDEDIDDNMYTIRAIKRTWYGRTQFGLYFEDTLIHTTNMDYESLKRIAFLLNTAYNLGFSSGNMYGQFESN